MRSWTNSSELVNCSSSLTQFPLAGPGYSKNHLTNSNNLSVQMINVPHHELDNSELVNNSSSMAQCSSTGPSHSKNHLINSNKLPTQRVQACVSCRKTNPGDGINLSRCTGCHTAHYCSTLCQQKHCSSHKSICFAIQELESKEQNSCVFDHLSYKQRSKVVKLVGKKCLMKCSLEDKMI